MAKRAYASSSRPGRFAHPNIEHVTFGELFALSDIQRFQDAFAAATNVGSIITDPEGKLLTRPSNFSDVCRIIRGTPAGLANCTHAAKALEHMEAAPALHSCRGSGLMEGGTGIFAGNRHLANWRVGQVLDATVDPERLVPYALSLGIDETTFRKALATVPRMTRERFWEICQALYKFANHLSFLAIRNHRREHLIVTLRQARANLRIRDRNLADIIDFLPDPTLVLGREGTIVFWNRALEALTGVSAAAMLGKADFEYATPFYGTRTPLLADYARGAVAEPNPRYAVVSREPDAIIAEADVLIPKLGPRRIWAKAVALRDETGRITGAIESIRDITDRHRAEMALRESEEKYRRIVETANEGVWVTDRQTRTTFVNQRMATMLGLTPDDMLGHRLETFLAGIEGTDIAHRLAEHLRGLSDCYELPLATSTGRLVWTLVSASPLHDATGSIVGSLGMFTDITDRKQVEAQLADYRQHLEDEVERRTSDLREQATELAEANIRLSELDRLKSLFLSTVSHELRTPLTSILGFAKLCARDFTEHVLPAVAEDPGLASRGKRIGDNLQVIFKEAERLTRLINDVLDLSRIESGSMEWGNRIIDARPIVRQTGHMLSGMLTERPEVTAELDLAPGPYPVRFEADQLAQVLTNLLNNAVKFTRAGHVRLSARFEEDSLVLAVHDSGIGIPEDELEAVFEKFHQLRHGDTMDDTSKGTGLGLAICRQIVGHYGGAIWAESTPGAGSSFYVRLPLVRDETKAKMPPAAGRE